MTITITPPVRTVLVSPATVNAKVGQSVTFTATGMDSSGAVVSGIRFSWSLSNSLARIDSLGVLTALSIGVDTVTAQQTSGIVKGTAVVTIIP